MGALGACMRALYTRASPSPCPQPHKHFHAPTPHLIPIPSRTCARACMRPPYLGRACEQRAGGYPCLHHDEHTAPPLRGPDCLSTFHPPAELKALSSATGTSLGYGMHQAEHASAPKKAKPAADSGSSGAVPTLTPAAA